jgi:F0F1-type ATP synthase assembly protein I
VTSQFHIFVSNHSGAFVLVIRLVDFVIRLSADLYGGSAVFLPQFCFLVLDSPLKHSGNYMYHRLLYH